MASLVTSAGASGPPPPQPPSKTPPQDHMGGQPEGEEEEEEEERDFLPEDNPPYRPKEHFIWSFFKLPPGSKKVNAAKVMCLICREELKRGNPLKKYSFGNHTMIRHMMRRHPNNYAAAEVRELAKKTTNPSSSSTSTAPTPSGAEASTLVPNVQPNFANFKFVCIYCNQTMSYGEQSITLLNRAAENHKCPRRQ